MSYMITEECENENACCDQWVTVAHEIARDIDEQILRCEIDVEVIQLVFNKNKTDAITLIEQVDSFLTKEYVNLSERVAIYGPKNTKQVEDNILQQEIHIELPGLAIISEKEREEVFRRLQQKS